MKALRLGVGGIRHETNTFSPVLTGYDDFVFRRGDAAVAGGLEPFQHMEGVTLLPTFVASAIPNGLVRRAAYSQLKAELLDELQSILPLDGLYLDLHGAMEVEEIGDAEGDLVKAVRQLVGPETLISVSLDLHGNISPTLVETADILTAFRTAPHRDYEETRRRAFDLMVQALQRQIKPVSVMIKLPLLLAGESAVTEREPAQSLYAGLAGIDQIPGIMTNSLLIGCAWTDSVYTTASVIVVAEQDRRLAHQKAAGLARQVWAQRHNFEFGVETATLDEAIRLAMAASERPVFISDSGDNVTAGGAGDLPLFVERLLALGAREALVAGLADPAAVRQCLAAGEGATVQLSIGGKLDQHNGRPLLVTGRVIRLSRDPENPQGPPAIALVQIEGVYIILAPDRRAFTERAAIAAAGLDPMRQQLVVVKLGYLFPDLADHAPRAIMALSPGTTTLNLAELPYRHLPRPIFPLDGDFEWQPAEL
jgi:microcystin degradation protein MlrC